MASRLRRFVPRRWWARGALIVLLLGGVAWLVLPRVAAPYVRGKLQAMIASKLNAELRMEDLAYLPPFGVRVRNAKLVAKNEADAGEFDLLKVARIDLRLAELPFGEGPLVIERIDVQQPEVYLVLTEHGLLGSTALTAPPQTRPAPGRPVLPPGTKLSDMFELRHFALWGGRVVLEDRTRPGSVPMVWSELNAGSASTPTSRSAYTFELKADHKGVAAMTASGWFDLDALHLKLDKAELEVKADPNLPTSGMPAQIQSLLRENHVAGKLGIQATADLPLNDLDAATFDATLRVTDGSARFPQTETPLERLNVVVRCRTLSGPAPRAIRVRVDQFDAAGSDLRLALGGGAKSASRPSLLIDRAAGTWTLSDLAAELNLGTPGTADPFDLAGRVSVAGAGRGPLQPPPGQTMLQASDYLATARLRGVRVRPPKFPLPLEDVGGDDASIELHPGVVVIKNVAAHYGGDEILVRGARVPLPAKLRELKDAFSVEEIDGRIDFRQQPNPPYPGKFDRTVQRLRPGGAFEVGGGSRVRVSRVPETGRRKSDYFFGVSADDASLGVTDKNVRLTNVSGDAAVSNLVLDITRLHCTLFGGTATASGKVVPKKPYAIEHGRLSLREIDLAQLARQFSTDKSGGKLTGRAFLNMTLAGSLDADGEVTPADALRGRGEFEVIEGDLWTLPVIGHVAARAKKNSGGSRNGGLVLGEAAGVFRLANRSVFIDNAAVTSPALGLIGSGTVGFDRALDLRIVAAPLGDWRDHVKRTGIPIVSDAAGEVVGGVQRALSAATRTLLYQFRVTGTADDPKIETIPAPVVTDPVALLLGRMVHEKPQRKLIDSVRSEPVR